MTLRFSARLLACALALGATGVGSAGPGYNVLIVANDTVSDTAATTLSGYLTAASYSVPPTPSATVPAGSLASYKQIWDLRYQTALSGTDITAYVAYLAGGGSLFVMGENDNIAFQPRDNSIVTLIGAAGGGSLTLSSVGNGSANLQIVQPPFTGPNSVVSVTFQAIGGFSTLGAGAAVTLDSSHIAGSVVFAPGTLSQAPDGTLIAVLDVNFLYSPSGGVNTVPFAENLIAFLAAPLPLLFPAPAPALSTWAMLVLAAGLVVIGFSLRRSKIA